MSAKNNNIINRVWFVSIAIAVAAGVLVGIIDARLSKDDPNEDARNLSRVKEEVRADREYVKVTLDTMREIVAGVRDRHPVEYSDFVMQDVAENDTVVIINLEGVEPHYVGTLIGSNENHSRFEDVYTKDINFHFRVSVLGGDTIVDCPAFILARLVHLYEK